MNRFSYLTSTMITADIIEHFSFILGKLCMTCDTEQHYNPVSSVIIPILQMRKSRQRDLRNLPTVISLKVAVSGFEPRQSDSSNSLLSCPVVGVFCRGLYLKLGNSDGSWPCHSLVGYSPGRGRFVSLFVRCWQ